MRAIRLLIEYDGSDFVGWQVQARGRTVQGELASALGILLRENIVPVEHDVAERDEEEDLHEAVLELLGDLNRELARGRRNTLVEILF